MRAIVFLALLCACSNAVPAPPDPMARSDAAVDAGVLADAGRAADASTAADASAALDASEAVDASEALDASEAIDGGVSLYDQVKAWAEAYKAAHPGGDWDINAKTPAEVANDPDAQRLLATCGADQRPVFPILAWEYGGSDHPWINPEASALLYCVYIPVNPSTDHWSYDAVADHVTADVYVAFPEENPCKDRVGRDQVAGCIGDVTNFEILVDTANLHDGMDVGLALAEASTELLLVLDDGSKVSLVLNQ